MDPPDHIAANTAGRTQEGRPFSAPSQLGSQRKKSLFTRDDRLAQDGARMMTGPFRPPTLPPSDANTTTSAAEPLPLLPPTPPPLPLPLHPLAYPHLLQPYPQQWLSI